MDTFSYVFCIALFVIAHGQTAEMNCKDDNAWINNWDGYHNNVQSEYFLNGLYSEHLNQVEDRRFTWRYCKPSSMTSFATTYTLSRTVWDSEWERNCKLINGPNSAIIGIESWHDDWREDREYTIHCGGLDQTKYQLNNCNWSGELNDYDAVIDYDCPNNGVIRGIWSKHDSGPEDRKFKFECCNVIENVITYSGMNCKEDSFYVNDWDGSHNNIQINYFLNGLYSIHDNHYEDRRFAWRYCKPSLMTSFTTTSELQQTDWDDEWERNCNSKNNGHSAIIGIESEHDDDYEDRRWTIHCGNLDLSKYRLNNCYWTGYLNGYDDLLDYDCPHNGVIRGIWSRHDNGPEDRLFNFECCNIVDVSYEFSDIIGYWKEIHSCLGCASSQYETFFGTESSTTSTIASSYTDSLSEAVTDGFKMNIGVSVEGISAGESASHSVQITNTHSSTISNSMSQAFSTTKTEGHEYICDKTYLYQWVITGNDAQSDDTTSGTFASFSNDYICTNTAYPQCPPGYCLNSDVDCQTCSTTFD